MNTDSFVFGEPESFFSYIVESNEKGIVVKQICEYSEEEAETMMTVGDLKNSKIRQLFPEKYASEDWISEEIEFIPEQKETVVEYVSFNDFVAGDDD